MLGNIAFPRYIWNLDSQNQSIFLTFDDGPIPGVTEWVLELLKSQNIKATFFCVGDNVRKYPHIFERIIDEGHAVGNHSFNHLNGWKTPREEYITNIAKASGLISSNLLRPPYGKILPYVGRTLSKKYKIIMWDVLSRDYDINLTGKQCARIVIDKARAGSIVVFHDSIKAERNLKVALPLVIKSLLRKGYHFDKIVL